MGKRRIKSEKVNFKKKLGLMRELAGRAEALKESLQPKDWNLGSPPTFTGKSDVAISESLPVKIFPEEVSHELPALDPESILSNP